MNWDDDDSVKAPPRRPGWGCLAALIVSTLGLVVVVLITAHYVGGIDPPKIR